MPFSVDNYLLIDIDNEFSQNFAQYYFDPNTHNSASTLIIAGSNTRKLVKMMFDGLIKDYCYCDMSNEISVSELASYLHQHHNIKGVLYNQVDYLLADDSQRFIFNSLHPIRFLVSQQNNGYLFTPVSDPSHSNHLSCQTDIAQTPQDLALLVQRLNKI